METARVILNSIVDSMNLIVRHFVIVTTCDIEDPLEWSAGCHAVPR